MSTSPSTNNNDAAPQGNFFIACDKIRDVIIFESWLRFYFITEVDEAIMLNIPEKALAKIKEMYPEYYSLAEWLNEQPIDAKVSQENICTFVATELAGKLFGFGPEELFGSETLQKNVELFYVWVQLFEDQLDDNFTPFQEWISLFEKWKESSVAQEIDKIQTGSQNPPESILKQ